MQEISEREFDRNGHDGLWRTYLKISKRFTWPGLRAGVTEYVKSCKICQVLKAKFKPRADRLCLRPNDVPPMDTVHLDFAELSKRSGPGTETRAFSVAIDRNTRFAAARAGGQDAQAVISLMNNRIFSRTTVFFGPLCCIAHCTTLACSYPWGGGRPGTSLWMDLLWACP